MKRVFSLLIVTILLFSACLAETTTYTHLEYGSKGAGVTQIQNRLKELGYYTIAVDGDYGGGTRGAVYSFQSRNGLEETGIADVATQEKLFSEDVVVAPPIPDVAVTKVKKNSYGTNTVTIQNNLDESIVSVELARIHFDASGRVSDMSGNISVNVESGASDYFQTETCNKEIKPGKTVSFETTWYTADAFISGYAVKSYTTKSKQNYMLANEQLRFTTNEGRVIYPKDENTPAYTMDLDTYNYANTLRVGYNTWPVPYYIESLIHVQQGDYITGVSSDSMAEKSGIKPGDLVVSIDGISPTAPYAYEQMKLKLLNGESEKIPVVYTRGGKEYTTYFAIDMEGIEVAEETSEVSVADELLKWADLLDKGLITQEEFDAQKKLLLG